ncbi:MAG: hypothetical protein ACFFB3_03480 [Candidatus Hodarchaeota archaeon]
MFQINHVKPDKFNLQEYLDFFAARRFPSVAEESQLSSLKERIEQTVRSQFQNYITDVIVATQDRGIVGSLFLGVMDHFVLIDEYDPTVKEMERQDAIALALIAKTKEIAISHDRDYIRLFLGGINKERLIDPFFQR